MQRHTKWTAVILTIVAGMSLDAYGELQAEKHKLNNTTPCDGTWACQGVECTDQFSGCNIEDRTTRQTFYQNTIC